VVDDETGRPIPDLQIRASHARTQGMRFFPGDAVAGILLLCSSGEAGPPAADTVLCSTIGRHTGDALANALRYEQTSASELMYRNAVELITDVVYECAPNGQFVYLSPRVEQLTG